MNMIMAYEDIMTPIEMLSNSNRLPTTQNFSLYETNLKTSLLFKSNSYPEDEKFIEEQFLSMYRNDFYPDGINTNDIPQIYELLSEPIPVCQFHTIEVSLS